MGIELGSVAPDFTAQSTHGEISFHQWIGEEWCLFFSHPRDFSAVCMTELGWVEKKLPEFKRRGLKPLGLSITSVEKHNEWSRDFKDALDCTLSYPLIADPDGVVANLYGMIHSQHAAGVTCRCIFIIDPARKIRMFAIYPTGVGRNFDEVLRVVDSLQLNGKHGLVTPANWRPGEAAVIPPAVTDDQARSRYPAGFQAVTPYLRLVNPPN